MRRTENGSLMVAERGRVVGVIALKELLDLFALKMELVLTGFRP